MAFLFEFYHKYTSLLPAPGKKKRGRNKGWRKAVRYALTENPVSDYTPAHRIELFKEVSAEREKPKGRPGARRKAKTVKSNDNRLKPKLPWQ